MKNFLLLFALLFLSLAAADALAGESGVILNGKKYVLYKDGKKVADLPKEARTPAGEASSEWAFQVSYTTDENNGTVCYRNMGAADSTLSCVKTK